MPSLYSPICLLLSISTANIDIVCSSLEQALRLQQVLLREDLLPDLHPLRLLASQWLPRILEGPRHDLPQLRPQSLDHQHRLPVRERETRAVAVEDYNAGIEVAADVAAEERNGEVRYGRGLMGIVESVTRVRE